MNGALPGKVPLAPGHWALFLGCVALTCAVALLTPPFQNPDEGAHYLRAYEVRKLHWVNPAGDVGVQMRCDEYLVAAQRYAPIAYFQAQAVEQQADPGCRARTINSAGMYAPISYLASAPVLRAGELLGWTVEHRLKAARLVNGLIGCLFVLAGILAIQRFRASFLLVCLLPMNFWQRAALSADSLLLGSAFLFVCWIARLAERRQRPTGLDWGVLLSNAVLIGSSKGVYALLCLAPVALWWERPEGLSKPRWAGFLFAPFVVSMGFAALWAKLADPALVYLGNGAQPVAQLRFITAHPLEFFSTIARTLSGEGTTWLRQLCGAFSWLPEVWGAAIAGVLVLTFVPLAATEANAFQRKQRWFFGALVAATAFACVLPLYLTYTPPGYEVILGVQGRYFSPLLPLLLLALASERRQSIWLSPAARGAMAAGLPGAILLLLVRLVSKS